MENKYSIIQADNVYHIYNRANGYEKIFLEDENYQFFLQQFKRYIHPFVDTYCYCLMPNHFHFLLKVKSENELFQALLKVKSNQHTDLSGFKNLTGLGDDYSNLISKQFSHFFNSYTKAFNRRNVRKGNLFMRPFKRKMIEEESYLRKLVHYIHYNPVEAALVEFPINWKYSSYKAIISNKQTMVCREEVLAIFEDSENFIYCHQVPPTISGIDW